MDKNKESLICAADASRLHPIGEVFPVLLDFETDDWPFRTESFDAILNVHYVSEMLWTLLIKTLRPNGLLLIETFENRGENYLQLPAKGRLKDFLAASFELIEYEERPAGPSHVDAVTVRLLARKNSD